VRDNPTLRVREAPGARKRTRWPHRPSARWVFSGVRAEAGIPRCAMRSRKTCRTTLLADSAVPSGASVRFDPNYLMRNRFWVGLRPRQPLAPKSTAYACSVGRW
jgi:hypothetical protein